MRCLTIHTDWQHRGQEVDCGNRKGRNENQRNVPEMRTTGLADVKMLPLPPQPITMALTLLTQPCSSRFASAVYASIHQKRGIAASSVTKNVQVNRAQAVEAASENIELGKVRLFAIA